MWWWLWCPGEGLFLCIGTIPTLYLKLCIESHVLTHPSRTRDWSTQWSTQMYVTPNVHPGHGPPPVSPDIFTASYTLQVFTLLTTYQLPMPSFAWVTDIAICCVCSLSVLITKGVFKGYLYVRHLSVTGMTGMTRNMESTGEYETAQKFTEMLSFLSLLSWGGVRVWKWVFQTFLRWWITK